MLAYSVFDPECLVEDALRAAGCLDNCEGLFRSIAEENAVLVGEGSGQLRQRLVDAVTALPSDVGQHLQAYLANILSSPRLRFIERQASATAESAVATDVEKAAGSGYCDAVWVNDPATYPCTAPCVRPKTRKAREYLRSDFEALRRSLRGPHPPIPALGRVAFDDLISRSVVGSRWLRFFERHAGLAAGEGKLGTVKQFAAGIAYVVGLWCKADSGAGLEVEVFTLAPKPNYSYPSIVAENENALRMVADALASVLPTNVQFTVEVKFGRDRFHARYLESEMTAVAFDGGFDFIKGGQLQNNLVKWDDNSAYLAQVRALPGIRSPPRGGSVRPARRS